MCIRDRLELLRSNHNGVLMAPQDLIPLQFAGALWDINVDLRHQLDDNARPPMLSWTFVRAVEEEVDGRFWHVIWEVLGDSGRRFRQILHDSRFGGSRRPPCRSDEHVCSDPAASSASSTRSVSHNWQ